MLKELKIRRINHNDKHAVFRKWSTISRRIMIGLPDTSIADFDRATSLLQGGDYSSGQAYKAIRGLSPKTAEFVMRNVKLIHCAFR